ncbi:BTAD domain-containing putative transcriptional regulator [Amycolatopsis sp. NPDC051373]|uniref:BTAD domain-containing putative transcriptional regulator n=1 Tax=Amycolatopsis sp. NPDC051373 TaxID=3155801 RepID=UPI00344F2A3E
MSWTVRGLFAAALLVALLAGLPFALIYGVGWPLPDHVPSLDELEALLLTPMSSTFLLNTLACVAWLLWTVFVLDVAACALDVVRGARWPQDSGPVRRVAAALVGTLLIALLGRTATAAPASTPSPGHLQSHTTSMATAADGRATATDTEATPPAQPVDPGVERVREPRNGVHDSLWRIAQRCLGDGDRWPELWALNRGSTQPDGRILSNPNLLHPGDLLRLPAAEPTPTPVAPAQPAAPHHLAPTLPNPETGPSPRAVAPPVSAAPVPEIVRTEHSGGAVTWGEGEVFIGLGLATAVSALLMLARRRRHARYQPGSGHRGDDLLAAPIVYQLRQAHLRAQRDDDLAVTHPAEPDGDPDFASDATLPAEPHGANRESVAASEPVGGQGSGAVQVLTTGARRVVGASAGTSPTSPLSAVDLALAPGASDETAAAGFGGGTQIALDLAHVHGLGLVGPGAYAAARALLLTLLTAPAPGGDAAPKVLLPAADLIRVTGLPTPAASLPRVITVTTDLDAALTRLDTDPAEPHQPRMLIATPPREPSRQARLQQLLDNGGTAGITAVLLGQWRPGVTAYVTASGIISATDPGPGEPLRGTRAFTLPEAATRDLLAFLRTTAPHDSTDSRTAEDDPPSDAPAPHRAATPSDAADPARAQNTGVGPQRLEITAGTPAPEPSPGKDGEPGDKPRPRAAGTDAGTPPPLTLAVFGAPALHWRPGPEHPQTEPRDLSGELSSRPVELLVFLAVHPGGVSRDAIVDALWPDEPPRNPASVLRTVLSRIRRTLDAATHGAVGQLVLAEHSQYRLDPAVVEVDYWGFADAVTRRRTAGTSERRADAYEAIVAHYGGALADGLDSDWLVAAREATRRDALDAVAALARAHVTTDPDYTLDLLETARAFDPHNELLYRDIMRLQHTLGRHDTISRTLSLLQTRLAEIDAVPTADTVDLAQRLRARDTGIPVEDFSRSTAP